MQQSLYSVTSPITVLIVWAVVIFVLTYFALLSFAFEFLKCKKGRLRPWTTFCWAILITVLILIFMWLTIYFSTK